MHLSAGVILREKLLEALSINLDRKTARNCKPWTVVDSMVVRGPRCEEQKQTIQEKQESQGHGIQHGQTVVVSCSLGLLLDLENLQHKIELHSGCFDWHLRTKKPKASKTFLQFNIVQSQRNCLTPTLDFKVHEQARKTKTDIMQFYSKLQKLKQFIKTIRQQKLAKSLARCLDARQYAAVQRLNIHLI